MNQECRIETESICQDVEDTQCSIVQDVLCRNITQTRQEVQGLGCVTRLVVCRFEEKCWTVEEELCNTVYDTILEKKCETVNITVPQRECNSIQEMVMKLECTVVNEIVTSPNCVAVLEKRLRR